MAAARNKNTGLILAIMIGGPALIAWAAWACILFTIFYSAVVATASV